jgi:zinc/manganese transport system permease protein
MVWADISRRSMWSGWDKAVSVIPSVFGPGFFSNGPVHTALIIGGLVAAVSAIVGMFTVARGQSFAGHALSDVGTAGGSAAFLVPRASPLYPLYGFVAMNLVAAGVMELSGVRRSRSRDVATGVVLGASLGLAALFLYLVTTTTSTTGAPITVLFGSLFALPFGALPVIATFSFVSVVVVLLLYRPLILSTLSPDLATARGVPVRLVGLLYLLALAIAVSLAALTIGAVLSTALLIGPAATALRIAKRPGRAMAVAAILGVAQIWLGILLAYDSYYWTSPHRGLPVSFFVVSIVFVTHLIVQAGSWRPRSNRTSRVAIGAA